MKGSMSFMDRLKRKSQSQSPVQPTKSKRLATVHFTETDDIVPITDPASCISDRERKELWYSDQSLDAFKTEVRLLCRRLRVAPDETESSRGLEHRICLIRQRKKQLALRCVLKAQSKSSCPLFLAAISLKCTEGAKRTALLEASKDFCEAYSTPFTSLEPSIECASANMVLSRDCKREFKDLGEGERHVRQRT